MPIANGFLSADRFKDEYFYEMKVASCGKCGMFQLLEQPDRELMFNDNYPFFSGTSRAMEAHFKVMADMIMSTVLKGAADPFVVEIGCNDGIMLKHFASAGVRHLGVEPSENVAECARSNNINVMSGFFDEHCAEKIVSVNGRADVFLAANVMCHIPYLHSIARGIKKLLKPGGVVIFEDPYLGDVLEKTSYDQIYDEHVFLFSVTSVNNMFSVYGIEVYHVEPLETHGGSMRYFLCDKGTREITGAVTEQLVKEEALGILLPSTYERFRGECEKSKHALVSLLKKIRGDGKRIVGYAATSKSTTIINYCGITPEQIDFICDTTPIKQGKFSPGAHIPVRPYEDFRSAYPDYSLLFAYNHFKEIMSKESSYLKSGGRWIIYVPEVKIL
jgi:methylation protein EvaC